MENGRGFSAHRSLGRLPNRIKRERIRRKATVVRSYCFFGENSASFLKIALKRVIFFGFYFEKELSSFLKKRSKKLSFKKRKNYNGIAHRLPLHRVSLRSPYTRSPPRVCDPTDLPCAVHKKNARQNGAFDALQLRFPYNYQSILKLIGGLL